MKKISKKIVASAILGTFIFLVGMTPATMTNAAQQPKVTVNTNKDTKNTTSNNSSIQSAISILYNNNKLTSDKEPILINGTVYVPLKFLSVSFGKHVGWVAATKQVVITDPTEPAENVKQLQQTIDNLKLESAQKDMKIKILEAEIAKLKEDAAKSKFSLRDIEKQLNSDYGRYKSINFDISLSGDEDDITVTIGVDLDSYKSKWDALSSSNKKDYLQDICDDISKTAKKADIEGKIVNTAKSSKPSLLTFTVSSSGNVSIKESSSSTSISRFRNTLNDDFEDYFSNIVLSIDLTGDSSDLTYTVYVDLNKYGTKWDALSSTSKKNLMKNIYNEISDEYSNANIIGYIYDSKTDKRLAKYTKSSSGSDNYNEYN